MIIPNYDLSDYITGDKFRELCDIDCEKNLYWEDTLELNSKPVLTVFCQTHELINVVPILRRYRETKFVMVSHNSDGTLSPKQGRSFDYCWGEVPNIVHWFSQNCEIDHPSVTPIPIALENEYIFRHEVKQQKMLNLNREKREKQLKLFLCFNIGTNKESRGAAWEKFSGVNWATCQKGFNNVDKIAPYFDSMSRHQFVLCPDGNGIDCIRTWEALYMGCIPIVERHVFSEYFAERLPMIIVNSWDAITIDFLNDMLKEFEVNGDCDYDYDMLTINYWAKLINRTLSDIESEQQCD